LSITDWQITTTTIYCDAVDDEATILVYGDGAIKCIGYSKYGSPDQNIAKILKNKGTKLNRTLECNGPKCYRVTGYRDKLFSEEGKNSR